jgi:hypothetical protein
VCYLYLDYALTSPEELPSVRIFLIADRLIVADDFDRSIAMVVPPFLGLSKPFIFPPRNWQESCQGRAAADSHLR